DSCFSVAGTLLLLLMSNLLLWEKAASVPQCQTEVGGCWEPLVETFNSAIDRVKTLRDVAEKMHLEFMELMILKNPTILRAGTHCHSNATIHPDGIVNTNIKTKKYLKQVIHLMGAWSRPLYHLVIELSVMKNVPESIISKAKSIEENNRELLDDLRSILTKVSNFLLAFPTAQIKEKDPVWDYLPSMKSNDKMNKFVAMFNLSFCLRKDIFYTVRHLRTLKCQITGKDC
ncbi:hypothetical protein U0070_020225, partial [Myodes glareolus]